ncbi:MAG: DUF3696 domain-containing protein [Methylotenera sp.]|nr:DUF3696 domain-containing protein [Methylotenera sp.]
MIIKSLKLTNFRSFKDTQTIELAPVTLLFGPNSVGKSSVLMALAYMQQILSKGHCNPEKLDALAHKTIGGFHSLVHGKDTSQTIKIRLDFVPDKTPFVEYSADVADMANHLNASYLLMNDIGGNTESGAIELEVAWSDRYQHAFVKNYRVWINESYIGCVNASDDLRNTFITEINSEHPLLIPLNHDDWFESQFGAEDQRDDIDPFETQSEFEQVLNEINPTSWTKPAVADNQIADSQFINRIAPIALSCRSGAIPLLGNPIITNLSGEEFNDPTEHLNYLVIREVLSQAFVLPLDRVLEYLNKSLLIGPLRIVPNSDYVPNPHPEQADWFDGSAAWDLLYKDPNSDSAIKKLIKDTNDWFGSEDKLNTGYEIINQSLAEELNSPNTTQLNHSALLHKRQISFKELRSNILLSANQLGTGISQVLPIVVAANMGQDCLISVEQPELHIHPRFQVELADVLLQTNNKHSYIIETHSEHLVLRLLRRIRESVSSINEASSLKPGDISIIYLTPTSEGTVAQRLLITSDGDFEQNWPNGFFDERDEELF